MITNATMVHTVLLLNVWLGVGYLMMRGLLRISFLQHALTESWRLKLARLAFLLLVGIPLLSPYLVTWLSIQPPLSFQFQPFLHRAATVLVSNQKISPFYQAMVSTSHAVIDIYDVTMIIIVIGMLSAFYRYIKSILSLRTLIQNGYQQHAMRGIAVMFSSQIAIPCCWRGLRKAYVILPTYLLEHKIDLKLALQHELQHLRQRDAIWLQLLALLKLLGIFNPLLMVWARWFDALHELACDEALVLNKKVMPQTYGQCLLNVAKAALTVASNPYPHFVVQPLMNIQASSLLNRRITMLFHYQKRQTKRSVLWGMSIGLALLASMTAYATTSNNTLNPLSVSQVTALWQPSDSANTLNMAITPEVVVEINQIRANPKAREFFRASLQRMAALAPVIRTQLKANKMPNDLLALPLAESGYQALPENKVQSAGIWQIIPSTARHYGLTVNATQDERFNLKRSTQAALAYLQKLHTEFNDWNLAIMAYNQGEDEIHRLIKQTGQSNAWQLIRSPLANPELKRYLPSVYAAVMIMRHPELI